MGAENKLKLVDTPEAISAEAQAKDEIDEIMNEIENLKESMTEAPKGKEPAAPVSLSQVSEPSEVVESSEPEVEEPVAPSVEEPESLSEPLEEEIAMPIQTHKTNEEEGCLTMTLSGKMTLRLQYEYADQGITIGFVDEMLRVELSDGTEFKIPIHKPVSYRKAA